MLVSIELSLTHFLSSSFSVGMTCKQLEVGKMAAAVGLDPAGGYEIEFE